MEPVIGEISAQIVRKQNNLILLTACGTFSEEGIPARHNK
jgi:hypothetical protein